MNLQIQQYDTLELASKKVVDHITETAETAVGDKGFCTIVLAGGKTPQLAYRLLSERIQSGQAIWQQCHFFWGDERCVDSTHADSNYFTVHKNLLSDVRISPENIHPIFTGCQTPEECAEIYEEHLRKFFQSKTPEHNIFPSFDLILLGMGADGHTASLFPGSGYLHEKEKWVTAVQEGIGSPPVARITLTLPIINQAKNVLFLISGNDKKRLLDTFINTPPLANDERYPAAHVRPAGKLTWIIAEEG
jgi:6-phosphogluconolactonase